MVATLIASSMSQAAESAHRFEIAVTGGGSFGQQFESTVVGTNKNENSGTGFSLFINMPQKVDDNNLLQYELFFSNMSGDVSMEGSPTQKYSTRSRYLHIGGTRETGTGNFRPYIALSTGVTNTKIQGEDQFYDWSFGAGGGIKWYPTQNIGIRWDARLIGTLISGDGPSLCDNQCLIKLQGQMWLQPQTTLGVSIRF